MPNDGFEGLGYRSANVMPDTGTGKPLRTHGEGRQCLGCGAWLSQYNPGMTCQSSCIPPDRRRVFPQAVATNGSGQPANDQSR